MINRDHLLLFLPACERKMLLFLKSLVDIKRMSVIEDVHGLLYFNKTFPANPSQSKHMSTLLSPQETPKGNLHPSLKVHSP